MLMSTLVRKAMIYRLKVDTKDAKKLEEQFQEKYLKISDFIECFLKNKKSFLRKIEPSKMSMEEQN
jgi:hypothetical protein